MLTQCIKFLDEEKERVLSRVNLDSENKEDILFEIDLNYIAVLRYLSIIFKDGFNLHNDLTPNYKQRTNEKYMDLYFRLRDHFDRMKETPEAYAKEPVFVASNIDEVDF